MKRGFSIGLALLAACAAPENETLFVADVAYDTLAVGGAFDEANPLLIYQQPLFPKLVDASTVVFADGAGGRLVSVDLVSGEGWDVQDHGAVGPGEFGGRQFWLTEDDGLILTASQLGELAMRSLDGELLRTRRYRTFVYSDPAIDDRPIGLLDGGVMVVQFSQTSRPSLDPQELRQGFRAYSPEEGLIWSYDSIPPLVMQWQQNDDGTWNGGPVSGGGYQASARLTTVVVFKAEESWLLILDADGTERGRANLPYDVYYAFVDGDERIWAQVAAETGIKRTSSYIVLDRDLNTLMQVTERGIEDARGDRILTGVFDSLGVRTLHLLERRGGR